MKCYKSVAAQPTTAGHRAAAQKRGLALDDLLGQIEKVAARFRLALSTFDIEKLASYAGAEAAIKELVRGTVKRHAAEVYTAKTLSLDVLGKDIYGDIYGDPSHRWGIVRYRVSKPFLAPVLRRVFELALGTIASLPPRYEKECSMKELRRVAPRLSGLAEELRRIVHRPGFRERIRVLENPDMGLLWTLDGSLDRAADMLNSTASLKLRRIRLDTPDPRVSFALHFADFLTACTGRPHYECLKTLLEAAFYATGTAAPKWVGRLEVEKTLKMRQRKLFISSITVSSAASNSVDPA